MATTAPSQLQQLEDYLEKVLTTAQPEAFDHRYLLPGIVGEVGEMFGHKAKAFWHGKPEADLNNELSYELGDVAWMTALLLHVEFTEDRGNPSPEWWTVDTRNDRVWGDLMREALAIHSFSYANRTDSLGFAAERLWAFMAANSVALTGHDFQTVLDRNIAKLADRAARGKLKGNGDHR